MAIAPVLRVVAKRLIPLLLELGFEELKALTMKENESGASVVLEGSYQGSEVNMLVSLTVGEDGMVTFGFGPYKTTGSISRWIQMLGDQFASMPSGKPGSVVKTLSNISLLTKLQKVISKFPKSLQKSAATPMEYARIARNVSDKYLDRYSVSKSAKEFPDRRNAGRLASAKWVRDEELAVRSSKNGLLPAAADVKGSWAVAYYLGTWYIVVIPPGLDTRGMKTGVEFRQVKNKTQGVSLVNAILTAYPHLISADEGDLKRNAAGLAEVIKTALEPRVRPPSNPKDISRKWESADIEIVTTKGNLTYSGIKYGTWAVLKTPDGWGVTNTPSGMRVTPLKNKAEGIKLVDTILKEYPQLWDAGKDEILQNTSVIIPLIKAMKESRGKTAKDLPKTVERYVKEHKEQGNDEAKSWALAWSRYCVAGSQYIPTSQGLKTIESIYEGFLAPENTLQVDFKVASSSEESRASHITYMGYKDVVSVRTKSGHTLICTPDHRVAYLSDAYQMNFCEARDLVGKQVLFPTSSIWSEENAKIDPVGFKNNSYNNVIPPLQPSEITPDLSYLLGFIAAEGTVNSAGIEVCNTDKSLIDKYCQHWFNVFGEYPKVSLHNRSKDSWKDIYKARNRTRWYREFFASIGVVSCNAFTKSIPDVVLQSKPETVAAFIGGYADGDGCLLPNKRKILLASVSKTLIEQLSACLHNFHIWHFIRSSKTSAGSTFYELSVNGSEMTELYMSLIGVYGKSWEQVTVRQHSSRAKMIPYGENLPAINGIRNVSLHSLNAQSGKSAENKYPNEFRPIRSFLELGWYTDTVEEIIESGKEHVYDLSVPEVENFVASGMIVHNCKHKEPNSPHCKQDDYFTGRKAAISPASQLYKVLLEAARSVGVDKDSQKFRAAVREADNFEEAVRSGLSDWVKENVKSFDERKYRGDVRKIVDVLMKSPDSEAPFVYFSELDGGGRANIFRKWRGFFSDPKKIETLSIFMQNHLRNPLKDLKEALEDVATEGAEAAEEAAAAAEEAEAEEGGDEEDNRGTSVEVSEDDDFFWNLLF